MRGKGGDPVDENKGKKKCSGTCFGSAVLCYVVFSLVRIQGDIQKNREQLAALEQQNEEQRIANKELERVLSDGTEEEYIERIAREQLGYAYPEEQVLIDISGS
ncbi:MAG: septum formation initiator family protein [Acutalibacteraceae bacterium]